MYGTRAGQEPRPWGGGGVRHTAYGIYHTTCKQQACHAPRPGGEEHIDHTAHGMQKTGDNHNHGRGGESAYKMRMQITGRSQASNMGEEDMRHMAYGMRHTKIHQAGNEPGPGGRRVPKIGRQGYRIHHTTCDMQTKGMQLAQTTGIGEHVMCNIQHTRYNIRHKPQATRHEQGGKGHATFNVQHMPCNVRDMTYNIRTVSNPRASTM